MTQLQAALNRKPERSLLITETEVGGVKYAMNQNMGGVKYVVRLLHHLVWRCWQVSAAA